MTSLKVFFVFILCNYASSAQTQYGVKGIFPQAVNTEIILKGFTMTGDTLLSKTNTDAKGKFEGLSYPASYVGAALLEIKDSKSVIVLLNQENFGMEWNDLEAFETLKFIDSPENDAFGKGVEVALHAENKLSGLKFLKSLYETAPQDSKKSKWLQDEIAFQEKAFPVFLKKLPTTSYAGYYLHLRKFLEDLPITANRLIERMPEHEKEFNNINFADSRLMQSGLYKELLDGYFQLMESHGDLPKVYEHINVSTDAVLNSLKQMPVQRQQAAEYLFRLFEKQSLFNAAEHLALSMLADDSCQLDGKNEALFEQYRKMAVGNTAPELVIENSKSQITKLSEIKNKYKLVVFGSSWCNKCIEEIPKIKTYYDQWKKEYDVEVVLVSLDTEKVKYEAFINDFPWISSVDYKGWEGKNARDYYVFGTPTMYLLNSDQKIVLKPISPEQTNAWLQQNASK